MKTKMEALPDTFMGYKLYPPPPGRNSFGRPLSPYVIKELPCRSCGKPIIMKAPVTLKFGKPFAIRRQQPFFDRKAMAIKVSIAPRKGGGQYEWECGTCACK